MKTVWVKNQFWILLLAALALLLPGLGQTPLLDWDEANFAEAAREMLLSHDFSQVQIGFAPFWEKPPLFFWLQALSFKFFGITEWAARLPNVLAAVLTLGFLVALGKKIKSQRVGFLWAWLYLVSVLPQFYFRTALIDPLFNLLTMLGLTGFYFYQKENSRLWFSAGVLACAAAIMTKGPTSLLMIGLVVLVQALRDRKRFAHYLVSGAIFGVLSLLPYTFWILGGKTLGDFSQYLIRLLVTPDAGHRGFLLYHFVVIALGCFPASVFMFWGWREKSTFQNWMKALLWIVLIVFTLVKTKIVHYSSLAYFPVTYFGALGLDVWLSSGDRTKRSQKVLFGVIGFILLGVLYSLPYISIHAEEFAPWIQDPFAKAALLEVQPFTKIELVGVGVLAWAFALCFLLIKHRPNFAKAMMIFSALSCSLLCWDYVPKIALIAQGVANQCYELAAHEGAKLDVYGFKSYAYLFYSKATADQNSQKAKYLVSKIQDVGAVKVLQPEMQEVERKGGFVLFKRGSK